MAKFILTWGMIVCYVILNSAGALLIKHKLINMGPVAFDHYSTVCRYFVRLLTSFEGIVGFACIFGSAFAWMVALSKMELSVAYPIAVGFNFLVVVSLSIALHGEILTVKQVIGVIFVLAGLFCMG